MTPLHLACKLGNEKIGVYLVDRTSQIHLTNLENSPLHLTCRNSKEKYDLAKKLLEKINSTSTNENNYILDLITNLDPKRQSLLQIVIENSHYNILDLIFEKYYMYDDLPDKNGNLPIHLVAKNGSKEALNILIKYKAMSFKPNIESDYPLHIAALNNRPQFITTFIAYEKEYFESLEGIQNLVPGVRCLNKEKQTPLYTAIINSNLKCVEILVNIEHVELNFRDMSGSSIYHICALYNNIEALRYLLTRKNKKFAEPLYIKDNNDETPVHIACKLGFLEVVKLILTKFLEGFASKENYLLEKNIQGQTCFHLACNQVTPFFNIVEYFLKDLKMIQFLDSTDNQDNTPLHLATSNGHLAICNLLIELGADQNARNSDLSTALEISCRKSFFEISKVIINKYTSVESDADIKNALFVAAYEGANEVVSLLLEKGAAIDTLNAEKKNCLDIAIERDKKEVIKVYFFLIID